MLSAILLTDIIRKPCFTWGIEPDARQIEFYMYFGTFFAVLGTLLFLLLCILLVLVKVFNFEALG